MITSILSRRRISKFAAAVIFVLLIMNYSLAQAEDKSMDNPFGVLEFLSWDFDWSNYKYAKDEDLSKVVSLIREAGIGWVRVDFLWHDIEPARGEFNFSKYDRIVEICRQNNIQILGLFNYNTPWSNASGEWNCPPKENKDFVNYATTLIQRYKGKVIYWEVWNEPDSAVYWAPQDGLKSYCVLLKKVYTAAKKANPECKILNGGLAEGLASVDKLYENGAQGYFDILNIHVFQTPLNPVALKVVLDFPWLAYKVMCRNGDADKKIWITEIGCPGEPAGVKTDKWWLGDNPDEAQQAAWVKQIYPALLKEEYIQNVFWAFFRDCKEHWKNGVDYFGLVRWDFSKKPSFEAYKKCVEERNASGRK